MGEGAEEDRNDIIVGRRSIITVVPKELFSGN